MSTEPEALRLADALELQWQREAEGAALGEYLFGFRAFRAAKFANAAADAVLRARSKP